MKVGFYLRTDAPSQQLVAARVSEGCLIMGEQVVLFSDHSYIEKMDVVVVHGIGGDAKVVWDKAKEMKKRSVLLDKPYIRGVKANNLPRYYLLRISVGNFQPLKYFQVTKHSSKRWDVLGIPLQPYKKHRSGNILFDGASNKYVKWCGLGSGVGHELEQWVDWGQRMVNEIRTYTDLPIVYRPRPSHNLTPTVSGAEVSENSLDDDFERAKVVVSHGGNIGYDAVVAGIPHFAIGDSIARPLSETAWHRIGIPFIPDEDQRCQWLADLAWCQWNLDEFQSGRAWKYIRETMELTEWIVN